jgi:hypothetical protein
VNRRAGRLILWPMVALGLFSVLSWARSESIGQGDLRLYLLVQFYPMLALPVIFLLFRSRYTYGGVFWVMWALYAVAKIAELYDGSILEGAASGAATPSSTWWRPVPRTCRSTACAIGRAAHRKPCLLDPMS